MPSRSTATTLLALLAAATLVACACAERPPSNRRSLRDDSRSVSFVWTTDRTTSLLFTGAGNSHGVLYTAPPTTIPASTSGLQGGYAASNGVMTGVEGNLQFRVKSGGTTGCSITVNYDNPYAGSNSYSCSISGGQACQQAIACTLTGGSGNNAVLNVNVYAQ